MRLILRYTHTDGCTFWCTNTLPVEYDSAEALLVDFSEAARKAFKSGDDFKFLGTEFSVSDFYEHVEAESVDSSTYLKRGKESYLESMPSILTLDEFFADAMGAKSK